jgi:hypothetical protein
VITDTKPRTTRSEAAGGARDRTVAGPWPTLGVIVAAFLVGSLLNARQLSDTAEAQPLGWQRNVAVTVTDGLVGVSEATGLHLPHLWADEALGRLDPATPPPGPGTPAGVFVPTAEQPAMLWVAGDSLVDTVGPAVVNAAAATGVLEARMEVQYSSGLTRPELYDWPAHLAAGLTESPSDIVVFMVGANDGQPIATGDGWASFGTEAWRTEYRARAGAVMDLLTDRVATVYWVGQPIPRDDVQAQRTLVMNEIYGSEAAARAAVTYVDAWALFADADGTYASHLPDEAGRPIQVRNIDGVHLTPAGADMLAAEILEAVGEVWQLADGP